MSAWTGIKTSSASSLAGILFVMVACSTTAKASDIGGEEMTPIVNGMRITFPAASLTHDGCQNESEGVSCYFPDRLVPYAVVSTSPKLVHGGAKVRATLEFSADWQGWVKDAASSAKMPMFSFVVLALKEDRIVGAARQSVVLADLRKQEVQTRAVVDRQCFDYVLADAKRQQVSTELDISAREDGMLGIQLDLSELFAGVGVVVHSMTMKVTHEERP